MERDHRLFRRNWCGWYFNSHAHVERDKFPCVVLGCLWISTHTLTWSVTFAVSTVWPVIKISTHTLTWSVTQSLTSSYLKNDISTHTLTWSVTFIEYLSFLIYWYFNSHAHVERDFRRRKNHWKIFYFNSHAHVERDVWGNVNKLLNPIFQLTRSRGAWRDAAMVCCENYNFNSHAHVERDEMPQWYVVKIIISTHTLTWSVTMHDSLHMAVNVFQLTRSRGAWLTKIF